MQLSEVLLVIILIVAALVLVAVCADIAFTMSIRSRLSTQKLKFLGFYEQDPATRESYAEFVIGNKALNEVGISKLGLKNGSVTFDLTALYKKRAGLRADDKLIIEQRSSLRFRLSESELATVLVDGKKGKLLGALKIYCVDLTGTYYEGKLKGVKKLAQKILTDVNNGNGVLRQSPRNDDV